MNKRFITLLSLLFAVLLVSAQNNDVEKKLKKIKAVSFFEKIEQADTTRQYYLMKITQLLDPNNPAAGTSQRNTYCI